MNECSLCTVIWLKKIQTHVFRLVVCVSLTKLLSPWQHVSFTEIKKQIILFGNARKVFKFLMSTTSRIYFVSWNWKNSLCHKMSPVLCQLQNRTQKQTRRGSFRFCRIYFILNSGTIISLNIHVRFCVANVQDGCLCGDPAVSGTWVGHSGKAQLRVFKTYVCKTE